MKEETIHNYRPTDADYEKAEMDLLRDALKRTPSQRFDMLMQLVKLGFMLKNAKIIRTPWIKTQNI